MNKLEIIEELDKLKLKIMFEEEQESDLERYERWIDKLLLRKTLPKILEDWHWTINSNEKYAIYQTVRALVDNLFYDKYKKDQEFHKNRSEYKRVIADVIAMTMFVQEEIKQKDE